MEDYLAVARRVFEGTRYTASDEDVRKLAENMALLEKRGLGKLNKRLVDARKHTKIFETIAEHNFAVILLTQQTSSNPISYEPSIGLQRPLDFKVEIGDITYWMQMKDLNRLKRENRQAKTIEKIKKATSDTKIAKFFSCLLSDDFKEICLPTLIDFIKDKAAAAAEDDSFLFTGTHNQKAKVAFWFPNNIELSELTLGYAGDLDILEITGLAKDQIKESLNNAAGAFTWKVDPKNINLIVMEADNKKDIDICNAVFGTKYELFVADRYSGCRKNDGLFQEYDYSAKVTGVIVIKRKREWVEEIGSLSPKEVISRLSTSEKEISSGMTPEEIKETLEWRDPGPISDYTLILYMNDKFKHLLEHIKGLLSFDKIVYNNMRPPMGQGNFFL